MLTSLDVVSVNVWQILISLTNLVLIFLIIKHFFYNKVKHMLDVRQKTIEDDYNAAREAKEQALADQQAYNEQLQGAKQEADRLIKRAVDLANDREYEILSEAKAKADGIRRQAENDAALERKKAEDGIKREIVEVSSILAEKLLEREVSSDDHRRFVDSFIESIGDSDDRS